MDRIVYGEGRQKLGKFKPDNRYEKIGSYKGLSVWLAQEDRFMNVQICCEKRSNIARLFGNKASYDRVMTVDLEKSRARLFKDSYEISMVLVDSTYQGYGLAPKIYRYLMKRMGITLKAGTQQSYGGRSVWNDLAKYKDVQVVGKKNRDCYDMQAGEEREMSTGIDDVNCYDSGNFTAYAYYIDL